MNATNIGTRGIPLKLANAVSLKAMDACNAGKSSTNITVAG